MTCAENSKADKTPVQLTNKLQLIKINVQTIWLIQINVQILASDMCKNWGSAKKSVQLYMSFLNCSTNGSHRKDPTKLRCHWPSIASNATLFAAASKAEGAVEAE